MNPRLGAKVGCVLLFAAAVVWGHPANAESPASTLAPALRGATAPRAKREWRVQAGGLHPEPALQGDVLFLFDPSTRTPFAVDLRTGERRWTAQGEVKTPPRRALDVNLAIAGDKLLVSADHKLSAYATKDGRLLWSRTDECHLRSASGPYFVQRCYGEKDVLRVGESAKGRRIRSFPEDRWNREALLTDNVFLLWNREKQVLQSYPLAKGGSAWKIGVVPAKPGEKPGNRLGGPSTLLQHGGVLVLLGAPTIAFDAASGRELWRREGQKDIQSHFDDSGLWLVEGERLLRLEPRTGKVLDEQTLPSEIRKLEAHRLTAAEDRILFVSSSNKVHPDAVMVTWTKQDPKPVVLRRPADASEMMVAGAFLLAMASIEGQISVLDPKSLEPPLADLPAEAAVTALRAELGAVDRLRDRALAELPHLAKYFAEIVGQPRHDLFNSALFYLAHIPAPEALPALIARLKQSVDDHERQLLFEALAKQDDLRASEALVSAVKNEAGRRDKKPFWRPQPSVSLYEQLWRTGRSTDIGLCPPAGTRPLPATANSEEIGTAHPMIFQGVAPDGSWVYVCQAREDTTGDGKVQVHYGHHGDTYGDDIRPYLVIGGGSGYAFDDILDSDPTGRYVAVREGPCLGLVDTKARTITNLPNADVREADAVFGPPRVVSFDGLGKLLYLKGGVPQNRLVMRLLATGEEQVLDPGPGNLWRASLDSDGAWITVDMVDGPEWPATATSLAHRICRGAPMSFGVYGRRGMDRVSRRLLPVTGGASRSMASLLRPHGVNLLIRDGAGALVEVDAKGEAQHTIVPASCRGSLLHADPGRGLVLVSCYDSMPATVQLFDREARPLLPNTPYPLAHRQDQDVIRPGRPRFIELAEGVWVDLDRRALFDQPTLDRSEVRMTTNWSERNRGLYARRGDGAVLSGPAVNQRRDDPPSGPLRWNRPLTK
jgi:hypothetical protein